MCQLMQQSDGIWVVSMIDNLDDNDDMETVTIEKRLWVEVVAAVILNFNSNGIDKYKEMVKTLHRIGSYNYAPKN